MTAGNASQGMLLAPSSDHARQGQSLGLRPLVLGGVVRRDAVEPSIMGADPVLRSDGAGAGRHDARRHGLHRGNEALRARFWPREDAGWTAIASTHGAVRLLGPPTGFTGGRLLITLSSILAETTRNTAWRNLRRWRWTTAMVIRRESDGKKMEPHPVDKLQTHRGADAEPPEALNSINRAMTRACGRISDIEADDVIDVM